MIINDRREPMRSMMGGTTVAPMTVPINRMPATNDHSNRRDNAENFIP